MKEFQDTGLPADPLVYKAFMAYACHHKTLSPALQVKDKGLRIAQLLSVTADADKELLAFSLLPQVSPTGHWAVERQFGKNITCLLEEVESCTKSGLAEMPYASDRAQIYILAALVVDMSHALATVKNTDLFMQAEPQPVKIYQLPDPAAFQMVLDCVKGKTSAPVLEQLYQDSVKQLRDARAQQMEMIARMEAEMPAENKLPPFANSGLPDYPEVRAVYNILTQDRHTRPEELSVALQIADILNTVPAASSPAAIAAALIMVGSSDKGLGDLSKWRGAGEDITAILGEKQNMTDKQSLKALADRRQLEAAIGIFNIDSKQQQAEKMLDILKKSAPPTAAEMQKGLFQDLQAYIQEEQKYVTSPTGMRLSKPLEEMYENKLNGLKALVAAHMPQDIKPQAVKQPQVKPGF